MDKQTVFTKTLKLKLLMAISLTILGTVIVWTVSIIKKHPGNADSAQALLEQAAAHLASRPSKTLELTNNAIDETRIQQSDAAIKLHHLRIQSLIMTHQLDYATDESEQLKRRLLTHPHSKDTLVSLYLTFSRLRAERGNYSQAEKEAANALKVANNYEISRYLGQINFVLGEIKLARSNFVEAKFYFEEVVRLYNKQYDPKDLIINALKNSSKIYFHFHQVSKAIAAYLEVIAILESVSDTDKVLSTYLELVQLLFKHDKKQLANQYTYKALSIIRSHNIYSEVVLKIIEHAISYTLSNDELDDLSDFLNNQLDTGYSFAEPEYVYFFSMYAQLLRKIDNSKDAVVNIEKYFNTNAELQERRLINVLKSYDDQGIRTNLNMKKNLSKLEKHNNKVLSGLLIVFIAFVSILFLNIIFYLYSKIKLTQRVLHCDNELQKLSTLDTLTHIQNRRGFMIQLDYELSKRSRKSKAFSIAVIDIDQFDDFKVKFGQDAGDNVLINISTLLQTSLSFSNICGRWNDQQFIILAIGQEVAFFAEYLSSMQQHLVEYPLIVSEKAPPLTLTIALTDIPIDEAYSITLMRIEDGINEGKERGGNCIILKPH